MESSVKKNSYKVYHTKLIVLVFSSIFGLIAIMGIVIHFAPEVVIRFLSNFAEHHYLLFGMMCALLALILNRYYLILLKRWSQHTEVKSGMGSIISKDRDS